MNKQSRVRRSDVAPGAPGAPGAPPAVPERRPLIVVLAGAGIVAAIGYSLVALVHSVVREDHSLMADPIAKLASGATGWAQSVNFIGLGLLMIAFAIGLHLGVRPRWGILALIPLVAGAGGQVWAGLASPSPPPFLLTFLGTGIGYILISRRMAADPDWRSLAGYTFGTGIALLVAVPAGVLLGIPPGSTPRPYSGLASWVLAGIWFVGTVVLALRLRHITTAGRR